MLCRLALLAIISSASIFASPVAFGRVAWATCGSGILESQEECDGHPSVDCAGECLNDCTCQLYGDCNCSGGLDAGDPVCAVLRLIDGFAAKNCIDSRGLVINEIDYAIPGVDDTEFVEIFNPTATDIALSGVRLVLYNGAGGASPAYHTTDLGASFATLESGPVPGCRIGRGCRVAGRFED